MRKIKAGTLVVFTSGDYSDYTHCGHFVALSDITDEDYQEAVKEELTKKEYTQSHDVVIANFILMGKLLEVSCNEVHLGRYGKVKPQLEVL